MLFFAIGYATIAMLVWMLWWQLRHGRVGPWTFVSIKRAGQPVSFWLHMVGNAGAIALVAYVMGAFT